MLAGLLAHGFGYKVGNHLMEANEENEKGFFELKTMARQNDAFLWDQGITWNSGVQKYDSQLAIQSLYNKKIPTACGNLALDFLNDPANVPWILKEPRLCITLKTWLP